MHDLEPIAEKLGRLIRLLAASNDGEALGAARALVRVLTNHGVDIHALAERVEKPGKLSQFDMKKLYESGVQDGHQRGVMDGKLLGFKDGFRQGEAVGLRKGKETGLREGRETGRQDGYRDGHARGFHEGKLAERIKAQTAAASAAAAKPAASNGFDVDDATAAEFNAHFGGFRQAPVAPVTPSPRVSRLDSAKLTRTIEVMRQHCQYTERSVEFLDDLLDRAQQYDPVYFSDAQRKWFEDLMRQAKRRGAQL
jgi:hypothetical protein